MSGSTTKAAAEWLMSAAPDPLTCRREWEDNPYATVLLPAGRRWDVLLVPGRLGYPAFDVLTRRVHDPGPVLADVGGTRTAFFVPPGQANPRTGSGIRGAGSGTWIAVPQPGRTTDGMRWLVPPDGTGTLNDPALLDDVLAEAAARQLP
ncbi:bifunctional DNA primase/polymerase [Streptomyces cinnabarinus]|uniref:Bifunctional DNA primase/polymerase n=1 Tax=Streptomyces cinnabarinus TaxID=67287 RepID=A0ABY7KQW3_9ACTN|nr:bifunctional DNA primase/polymerase [Streptomyces cinnabarinus]WAZ26985.1 bifunctional DNA primase/polymerase [Streptomyces cinnabarinus]